VLRGAFNFTLYTFHFLLESYSSVEGKSWLDEGLLWIFCGFCFGIGIFMIIFAEINQLLFLL